MTNRWWEILRLNFIDFSVLTSIFFDCQGFLLNDWHSFDGLDYSNPITLFWYSFHWCFEPFSWYLTNTIANQLKSIKHVYVQGHRESHVVRTVNHLTELNFQLWMRFFSFPWPSFKLCGKFHAEVTCKGIITFNSYNRHETKRKVQNTWPVEMLSSSICCRYK